MKATQEGRVMLPMDVDSVMWNGITGNSLFLANGSKQPEDMEHAKRIWDSGTRASPMVDALLKLLQAKAEAQREQGAPAIHGLPWEAQVAGTQFIKKFWNGELGHDATHDVSLFNTDPKAHAGLLSPVLDSFLAKYAPSLNRMDVGMEL
jgi:hypothetical protein